MTGISLYARLVGISIRAQMQYRLSLTLRTLGSLLLTGGEFLGIWALFNRFGSLGGWSLAEVCVFYGLTNVSFGTSKILTSGFGHIGELVRSGTFDRILLRPRSTVLQLLGHEVTLRQVGRLAQGVVVLLFGLAGTGGSPLAIAVVLPAAIAGGVLLFAGMEILQAALAFKTIEALEVVNVFTYGGTAAAGYPLAIFEQWFRRLFIFIVPLGAVSYYPALLLAGSADPLGAPSWVGWISPVAGLLFFIVALLVWNRALRWYSSTGA